MPPSSSGDIEIEIIRVPSSAPPAYEALSYVWGSPERTHEVTVKTSSKKCFPRRSRRGRFLSGRSKFELSHLAISRNLFIALQHLSFTKKPRLLWIDAICINQDDVAERSEQVKKMASIYGSAQLVILWLGEEAHQSSSAIKTLRALGNGVDVSNLGGGLRSISNKPGSLTEKLEDNPEDVAQMATSWAVIGKLLERPWFTRLWVIQEMVLAAEAIVMIGDAVLPLPIFQAALFWIDGNYHTFGTLRETLNFEALDQALSMNLCGTLSDLPNVAFLTRKTHCLDPRDRIYAILSLLPEGVSAGIVPNYSKAPEEVFKNTFLQEINIVQQMDMLSLCRFIDPASVLPLPSWVFDFSVPYQLSNVLPLKNATGRSRSESRYEPSDNSLTIQGLQICVIDQVFEAVPFDAKLPEILTKCQAWELLCRYTTSQIGGVPSIDAFIATIFSQSIADALFTADTLFTGVVLDTQILRKLYALACERKDFTTLSSDRAENMEAEMRYLGTIEKTVRGRRLFRTHSGMLGLCPAWVSKGDIVIAALGCNLPLALRATEGNRYQVGGGCFVHGMMNGEALLGPLSPGSRFGWRDVAGNLEAVVVDDNRVPTQLDPRAGPLPTGWSVQYGDSDEPDVEIEDGEFKEQWFYCSETEEWTGYDPRLTSENLKKMGVDIQEFVLV
ncbi:heterokaryon incompatibility protein-domain-containing protein [Hyaloscypha sp. PMI_1271]|nr:heterokaryon incompatibility protein-domain-containing protein [Hyaloscypha sp. PMI_1271]